MSNDDSTRGSGGGFRDRDRLPPYAPTPAGWVLPEDTGAVELPNTGAASDNGTDNGAAVETPVIPDPLEPTPETDGEPAAVPTPPAGDVDTDAVTPEDIEALPAVDESADAVVESQELAWGAVPAVASIHPESPNDTDHEPETTVLPAVSEPGEVSRTEAIAGLTGPASEPTNALATDQATDSATGEPESAANPVASDDDAAASAAALAGKVPSRLEQNRGKDPIRTIARGIGQTLITLGVVVLLFVVYEVYVTDLFGDQKQEKVQEALDEKWAQKSETVPSGATETEVPATSAEPPAPAAQVVDPAERVRNYDTAIGEGFAKILIPALGSDYEYTIVEGTTVEDLYGSPGHYEDTQYPGELGNFAVAGHRVSKGSPFNALGTLSSCDSIVIETQDDWFVYRLLPMEDEMQAWNPASRAECADVKPLDGEYAGLPGREITLPSDYAQVLPVPRVNAAGPEALAAATQRIITLTTCHPQFSDAERMIVHGVLVKSYAKADGFVPPELNEV